MSEPAENIKLAEEAPGFGAISWIPVDPANREHVDVFKRLYRECVEEAWFSLAGITDGILEGALSTRGNLFYFGQAEKPDPKKGILGVAGVVNINWIDSSGELSCTVAPHWRRHGVARHSLEQLVTLATQHLGLRRVYAQVLDGGASHQLLEKSGVLFHEATLRQVRRYKGRFRDVHVFSNLKGD